MNVLEVDVAIIGAGTAGMNAYRAARSAGRKAVLIESGAYGTMCARVGCMPSKLLIAAADAAHAVAGSEAFGVRIQGAVHIDGRQVMERVKRERDRFVGFVVDTIDAMPAEDKLKGQAFFLSDKLLQVGENTQVKARSTVIAVGSTPFVPELYKELGDRLVVNDDVFSWVDLPKRVLVVGAGPIGLELGQALSRLGVQVTVTGRSNRLGGITDPVVSASALKAFQAEFDLRLNTQIEQVERQGNEVLVHFATKGAGEVVSGSYDYVLMAAGRRPVLEALGLHNTAAKLDEKGMPQLNAQTLQIDGTSLFLAGDANGLIPLLHEASDDGYIAGNNAAQFPEVQPGKRRARLAIVFSDPQIAHVGTPFEQLPDNAVIGALDFSNQGRSRIMLKNQGMLRVYAEPGSGRFLGAEMAGPAAEHIGHLLAWSVQAGLTLRDMLDMPFYHPVVEEGLRTALRDALKQLEAAT